ncbi:Holliday junction branch migration protein RuvA [Patescibacteria group bacterium]|nr:Holliday junction branch migration protein RuvA [Patescibacteria group bacterium]
MIYMLEGKLRSVGDNFLVLGVGGVGFKVHTNKQTLAGLPAMSEPLTVYCYTYVREDALDLFGFREEGALKLFELLNSVSGIGPRTALAILDLDTVPNIMAAIIEKRTDLISRAPGIGEKTAGRVVLELQNRIKLPKANALSQSMGVNAEVEEALVGLGYNRPDVRKVLSEVGAEKRTLEERLREALKMMGRRA